MWGLLIAFAAVAVACVVAYAFCRAGAEADRAAEAAEAELLAKIEKPPLSPGELYFARPETKDAA